VSAQLALLPQYLTAHLQLTLVALLFGIAFSVPAGVLVTRVRWLEQPVLGIASLIQTIPGWRCWRSWFRCWRRSGWGIGFLPAIVGLTLYSVLPIRTTATGLTGVDPALTGGGVGMTPGQQLRRVELPMAMPMIVADIRTATVWTVGMATLATPVGATSLGNYIFTGLQTRNLGSVLLGCAAASALALLLDGLVRLLEAGLHRRSRALVAASLIGVGVLCAIAAAAAFGGSGSGRPAPVRIGAKTFTEQYILASAAPAATPAASPASWCQPGPNVVFDALRPAT
jgi:osmoprotectant transport system permease protein